jgi:hypothetical protein
MVEPKQTLIAFYMTAGQILIVQNNSTVLGAQTHYSYALQPRLRAMQILDAALASAQNIKPVSQSFF